MNHLIQGTPEWLALRKNKIGASDSAPILGLSPWTSAYQLWARKLGLIPESPTTEVMRRGNELEPIAREMFILETGIDILPDVKFHPVRDWQMSSLDGWNERERVAVEIKCGGKNLFDQACNNIIPDYYFCQMQHQMSTLEIDQMFYLVFFSGNVKIVDVQRDSGFITEMIDKETRFWDCLQNLEAPELTDKDYTEREDFEWIETTNQWKELKKNLKELEAQEKYFRERLIDLSGKSNCKGNGIKLSRTVRRGSIDYTSIPQLKNINLNSYRKESLETYRISEYG